MRQKLTETPMIDALAHGATRAIRDRTSAHATVGALRAQLEAALANDAFVLECLSRAADGVSPQSATWRNVPLYEDDDLEFGIKLLYWPAAFENAPHEHTSWTVSGVLFNRLTFKTFGQRGPNGPEIADVIPALKGQVGAIVPPGIHCVCNDSSMGSLSIHIFSGPKNGEGRGKTTWFAAEAPAGETPPPRLDALLETLIAAVPAALGTSALPLLETLYWRGGRSAKLAAAQRIGPIDRQRASVLLFDLAHACGEPDARSLRMLAAALMTAT